MDVVIEKIMDKELSKNDAGFNAAVQVWDSSDPIYETLEHVWLNTKDSWTRGESYEHVGPAVPNNELHGP